MISSLLLLSLGTFATPVFISEVRAAREAGHLRVEVRGDGGIDPEAARTRIDDGRLILFLGGARVRADNRAWNLEDGVGEIRAHRHRTETELDIPLTGNGCAGPVELQGTSTGLTALVGCEGAVPTSARGGVEHRGAAARRVTTPGPAVQAKAGGPSRDDDTLEALVALPSGEPTPATATGRAPSAALGKPAAATPARTTAAGQANATVAAATPAKAESGSSSPAPAKAAGLPAREFAPPTAPIPTGTAPTVATTELAAALPAKPLLLPPPGGDVTDAPAKTSGEDAPARLRAVSLPALLLGGLALAAYLFARRRRLPKLRQIEILETASLGPKRSLVVARIGEETLFLGSSEAGITLLKSSGGVSDALTAIAPPTASAGAGAVAVDAPAAPVVAPAAASPRVSGPATRETRAFGESFDRFTVEESEAFGAPAKETSAHDVEMSQPLVDALADVPQPDGGAEPLVRGATFRSIEGGLASLFGRGGVASNASPARATATRFDDILEDSLEDQELRRKLAAGMSTRVR